MLSYAHPDVFHTPYVAMCHFIRATYPTVMSGTLCVIHRSYSLCLIHSTMQLVMLCTYNSTCLTVSYTLHVVPCTYTRLYFTVSHTLHDAYTYNQDPFHALFTGHTHCHSDARRTISTESTYTTHTVHIPQTSSEHGINVTTHIPSTVIFQTTQIKQALTAICVSHATHTVHPPTRR